MMKKIGYILMLIGLLLPLVLLTNMSLHEFQTYRHYQSYQNRSTSFSAEQKEAIDTYEEQISSGDIPTIDPFAEKNSSDSNSVVVPNLEGGVIGYLSIPSIEIRQPIYIGATAQHLNDGVASVIGTDLPVGGIGRRSVIAGHRGWYTDLRFFRLSELKEGDRIFIEIGGTTLTYLVKNTEVIKATDWQKLLPVENQDMVTLLTCDPLVPPFDYRLLVNAYREPDVSEVVKEEVTGQENKDEIKQYENSSISSVLYITVLGWLLFLYILYCFIKLLTKTSCQGLR
ncbi:class C sortase [Streptococcus suis]|uniref:class C sortase n=1 Tax=Streptococcus suis TaxID=1307 RepID=UPI001553A346|nr:class C sortase [Streptococcus suis]MBY5022536.1 class C sortase [Streptococcus suis]NQN85484.1 class C sortase [Streptococcus suis]NQO20280.1 class C sortase [Streptococcus suis]NQO24541.1 class C sortase [Streptococcus suis]HEP1800771.1 class C sortase [Streptococcus suis]